MNPRSDSQAARADLQKIFHGALKAVDPARLVGRALDGVLPNSEEVPRLIADAARIFLFAVGKASSAMALEIERRLATKLADAIAVIPKSVADAATAPVPGSKIRFLAAAHPLPDESSVAAARAARAMLAQATADDLVIVAVSGGASAMCAMPPAGISLADKIAINQALLRAGATIRELNTVRKHLSAIKGGRLIRLAGGARVLGLILSDVSGNEISTIGSGLTAADSSTYADAVGVLKRRDIWGRAPESIREYLERAVAGGIDETLKNNDPALTRVTNLIVGDNRLAIEGAERAAAALGYNPLRWKEMRGEANDVGRALAVYLCEVTGRRACVVAGGEPVVTVRGGGRGGRAQQCALAMGIELAQIAAGRSLQIEALFAGTDGIDGPTEAAGAFASPATVADGERAGLTAKVAIDRNNAYNFFKATDGLFVTGATGTNVSDVFIGLVNY